MGTGVFGGEHRLVVKLVAVFLVKELEDFRPTKHSAKAPVGPKLAHILACRRVELGFGLPVGLLRPSDEGFEGRISGNADDRHKGSDNPERCEAEQNVLQLHRNENELKSRCCPRR